MLASITSLFHSGLDPVTGDTLTPGEQVSWLMQRIMRRWAFLGVFTALTVYVFVALDPVWRHNATDVWNLCASYLAIFVEGVTAMALINQTRRDAAIIRHILAMEEQNVRMEKAHGRMLVGLVWLNVAQVSLPLLALGLGAALLARRSVRSRSAEARRRR